MKTKTMPPEMLTAATGLLQSYVPDLTPRTLLDAIKTYSPAPQIERRLEKPLTRREAAALLGVSGNTIDRYANIGLLRKIHLSAHAVRICPASVAAILAGQTAAATEPTI